MKTVNNRKVLKDKANREIKELKKFWNESYPPIIADIGGNIGYYSEVLLSTFDKSQVHSYEPHPYNLNHLNKINSDRLTIHNYGLFNETKRLEIGLPAHRTDNNGLFSIHYTTNAVEVDLKNANDEIIRPHIVKIDVEGSEPQILECSEFFSKTKIILIEIVHQDDFNMNIRVSAMLKSMGFKYKTNTSKNNELWLR